MRNVKMVDLHRQYLLIKSEIDRAIQDVIDSTEFIQGSAVRAFERDLGTYLGVGGAQVVGCASGTEALQIAFMALGIQPGDEVITTPFTFVATVEALVLVGGKPVFVDIDPQTYNLDVSAIEGLISERTKAIVPVHLYGHPAEMDEIMRIARQHRLAVIEDAAQAIGATYRGRPVSTIGDIGCLSFFPSKNLGAYGDGGALVVRDGQLAERCRMLANHGSKERYKHELLGINSRLDSLQAAILRIKLSHLESFTEGRIRAAGLYSEQLAPLNLVAPVTRPHVRHVFHQYSIRTSRRDDLARHLADRGVATAIHYPVPLHRQPAFSHLVPRGQSFPVADATAGEILSLPIFPEIDREEIDYVTSSILEFFKKP